MASRKRNTLTQSTKVPKSDTVGAHFANNTCHGKGKKLFVMRHGERCDFAFGKGWIKRCFDDSGNYTQRDLNLPKQMIPRDSVNDFAKDSPLTEIGMLQAKSTGEAFKSADVDIKHIYVSPSLRCVQTAQCVLNGMASQAEICIEPAAFEWLGWYKSGLPNWLSPEQLADIGFNINCKYKPFMESKDYQLDETASDYYDRCHKLSEHILKTHEEDSNNILIVAHAGSLDTFTRRLRGKAPRTSQEMHQILSNFTYCCLCCLSHTGKTGRWVLVEPPIPPLHEFDWKILL